MVSANSDTNFNCSNFSTAEHDVSNQNTIHYTQECSVYIYAICFSTIKKCSYWTDQTQIAIVEQAVQSNDDFFYESQTLFPIFPEAIQICGLKIDILCTSRHEGTISLTSVHC